MFISDKYRKYLLRNFWGAAFLLVFTAVYECFSHGVVSYYMVGAFLIPAVGAIPYIIMESMKVGENVGTLPRELWQLGIFTLAQGSVIQGVIRIYGTTNRWTLVYLPVGMVFMAVAGIAAMVQSKRL